MAKKMPKKRGPKKKGHKTLIQTGRTRAAKKQASEVADVPEGKKRGAIAERRKQAEAEKLEKIAAMDSKTIEVLGILEPIAKEINHRFSQASQLDGKADDHRLAAALQLEAARRQCKEVKINFQKWCEENVKKSYDEVRKLVAVARQPEPAKALADLRAGAASRNRDMRKRQQESRGHRDSPVVWSTSGPAAKAESAQEAAGALLASLPDNQQVSLMSQRAHDIGMALVSSTDRNRLAQLDRDEPADSFATPEEVYKGFLSLKAKDKLKFVEQVVEHVGGEFKHDFNTGVPEKMRRAKGNDRHTASV